VPRVRSFQGFPTPNMSFAIGSMDLVTNVKLRILQSAVDTVVACVGSRTWWSLGDGVSTSLSWRRSGDPYRVCRIAFTRVPCLALGPKKIPGQATGQARGYARKTEPKSARPPSRVLI